MTSLLRRRHLQAWLIIAMGLISIVATAVAYRSRPTPVNPLLWEDLK